MSLLQINERLEGFKEIDFDRKQVRKAMRRLGADIQKAAKQKVSGRQISLPGEYPGRQSGVLRRSIKNKVSRSGFQTIVRPEKIAGMKDFYPAFLFYGVTGNARRADHKPQARNGSWRVAPRKNYIADALDEKQSDVRRVLRETLINSLSPK